MRKLRELETKPPKVDNSNPMNYLNL